MVFGSKSRRSSFFTKSRTRSRHTSSSSQPSVRRGNEWVSVSSDDEAKGPQASASGGRDALVETLRGWSSTRAGLLGKGDQETQDAIQHLITSTPGESVPASDSRAQARLETNRGLKRSAGKGTTSTTGKRQSSVSKGKGKERDKVSSLSLLRKQ